MHVPGLGWWAVRLHVSSLRLSRVPGPEAAALGSREPHWGSPGGATATRGPPRTLPERAVWGEGSPSAPGTLRPSFGSVFLG